MIKLNLVMKERSTKDYSKIVEDESTVKERIVLVLSKTIDLVITLHESEGSYLVEYDYEDNGHDVKVLMYSELRKGKIAEVIVEQLIHRMGLADKYHPDDRVDEEEEAVIELASLLLTVYDPEGKLLGWLDEDWVKEICAIDEDILKVKDKEMYRCIHRSMPDDFVWGVYLQYLLDNTAEKPFLDIRLVWLRFYREFYNVVGEQVNGRKGHVFKINSVTPFYEWMVENLDFAIKQQENPVKRRSFEAPLDSLVGEEPLFSHPAYNELTEVHDSGLGELISKRMHEEFGSKNK